MLSPSPLLNPIPHTASLLTIWGYLLISPDLHTLPELSNTLPQSSSLHSLHTMPISGRTICPVCYCCYSLHSSSPLLSSLANKASDPRLSEAAPAPGLFTEAVPVSPRSLAIFQDLSPVTSYTCKYNGLGDYWAINNNARKAQKGVDLCFFSLSPKWLISNLCSV